MKQGSERPDGRRAFILAAKELYHGLKLVAQDLKPGAYGKPIAPDATSKAAGHLRDMATRAQALLNRVRADSDPN